MNFLESPEKEPRIGTDELEIGAEEKKLRVPASPFAESDLPGGEKKKSFTFGGAREIFRTMIAPRLCLPDMKMLIVLLVSAVAWGAQANPLASGPGAVPSPTPVLKGWERIPETVNILRDVEIGKGGDQVLHADLAWPKAPAKTPMPAILWIHGGGWRGGSHKPNKAMYFAERGYFTASIEYRLGWVVKWPDEIQDCKLGVRWLRANAAKYHVDPERFGCWGESAGGHLVSCLGTMDDPKLEGQGGYEGVSSRVQAVVDWCGPVDFTRGGFNDDNDLILPSEQKNATGTIAALLGVAFDKDPEAWKAASPISHVASGTAPFLIVHGDRDMLVSVSQSTRFAAALKQAGSPAELIVVKNGGHSLNAPAGMPPATPGVPEILSRMAAFFDKNLKR